MPACRRHTEKISAVSQIVLGSQKDYQGMAFRQWRVLSSCREKSTH
jgi:hypothetical protein